MLHLVQETFELRGMVHLVELENQDTVFRSSMTQQVHLFDQVVGMQSPQSCLGIMSLQWSRDEKSERRVERVERGEVRGTAGHADSGLQKRGEAVCWEITTEITSTRCRKGG